MLTISRCYDSHIHLFGTGQVASALKLSDMQAPEDVKSLPLQPEYFRGEWLVGFGWDQNRWTPKTMPRKEILDKIFPKTPVSFLRADGHAVWVNSEALQRAGITQQTQNIFGGRIERDADGTPSGVLVDSAKEIIDRLIPNPSQKQAFSFAKRALRVFNKAGFTHLRDMTSSLEEFEILRALEEKKELTAYIQLNLLCSKLSDLENKIKALNDISKRQTGHLRTEGIKIFYDGALGSEGALLSQCYCGTQKKGFTLWTLPEVEEIFRKTWACHLPVSVHTIGDEAAHQIVNLACQLKGKNIQGQLNLEHVEILRTETLQKMTEINPVCHMQPCHWLNDRKWIFQKIGDLSRFVFPWAALEERNIPFFFGSDCPIEMPTLAGTKKALEESALQGIPGLKKDWVPRHSHPDPSWGSQCRTLMTEQGDCQVIFDGEPLTLASDRST